MLDDANILKQRDPSGTLQGVAGMVEQLNWQPNIEAGKHDGRELKNVIIAGMGGSALGADVLRIAAEHQLSIPFEVVKGYDLPSWSNPSTLVVTVSHSGNTEETISCFMEARERGCQIAVVASGGKLLELAKEGNVAHVAVPNHTQPRLSIVYHLRAVIAALAQFGVMPEALLDELEAMSPWLVDEMKHWHAAVPVHDNYAKQLALLAVGKTPVIYGGPLTAPLAYKWKISWNENAKNVAFCNQYPEFNHNEFIGWSSHPVDKPFVIFDLRSHLEPARITERMELSDRLLSGLRPKAHVIELKGDSLLAQWLWGVALADMTSIYVAVLNGVNPEPVVLVEKLKRELS